MDIDALFEIGIAAGHAILGVYADPDFQHRLKGDDSPVTEADLRAEEIIHAALARLAPDNPVVAEEAASAGHLPDVGERFFLVDPLDGTREFLARNGEFTVNIALVENGVPVTGMVYAPALGRLYAGGRGGACAARAEGDHAVERRPISVRQAPPEIVAVGSRSHGSSETADWLARYPVGRFVASGSSLKFCVVATGDADIYPRLGPTMEWDTAAGDAVLRAAGGLVTTLDGEPLVYGAGRGPKPFGNPFFVAFGDRSLIDRCRGPVAV